MQMLEKPIVKRLLAAGFVIWLVVGAGLWARIESMPAQLDPSVVQLGVVTLEDGRAEAWQSAPVRLRLQIDDIHDEVQAAGEFLQALGGLPSPVTLRVNFQNTKRFRVEARELEIGSEIAARSGQIRHAIVKAWIQQTLAPEFSRSVFRQNVLADTLMMLASNKLDLAVPGRVQRVSYDGIQSSFFEQVGTIRATCASTWVSMEILAVCDQLKTSEQPENEVYPLSLRRVVGETVWRSIASMTAFERMQFLKLWISYLTKDTGAIASGEVNTGSMWDWRTWARNESEQLMPASLIEQTGATEAGMRFRGAVRDSLKASGLDDSQIYSVDLVARFSTQEAAADFGFDVFSKKRIQIGMPPVRAAIASVGDDYYLLPGGARVRAEDLKRLRSRRAIWESCEFPTVQDILSYPVQSDRTLLVQNCKAKENPHYRSFIAYGVEGFALDNPDVQFIQVHRPSLEFAAAKGLMKDRDLFEQLLANSKPQADRKLGLAEAQWDKQLSAYRVLGAIEAIEWYRGKL